MFGGWILGNDSGGECPGRIIVCICGHGKGSPRGQPATDSHAFPSGTDRSVRILDSTGKEDGDMITSNDSEGRRTLKRFGAFYALVKFRYEERKSSDFEVDRAQSLIGMCHSV